MFKFYIYKIGFFIANRLPKEFVNRFAIFLSDMQYLFSFRDRRNVRNNLKIILPSHENLSSQTREVFRNFGRYLLEFFRMQRMIDQEYIRRNIKLGNLDIIHKVLEKGKGAIFLTAHIGNWELGAVVMAMLGFPVVVIALPNKERPVNDLFNKQRELKGVRVVQANSAIRKCVEILKNNQIVALAADRDFSENGIVMDFFGKKTLIPKGTAIFSMKTGAPIIPVFLTRNEDNTFTLVIEEPIAPGVMQHGDIDHQVLMPTMKKYTAIIEDKIRQFPTQWLMFRPFWV